MQQHWRRIAADQEDTLARWQALRGGMTPEAWEWRLERGLWQRVLAGVAVTHSGTPTDKQRSFAAVLHGGRDAALSGDAALVEAGFKGLVLRAIDVAVPPQRRVVGSDLLEGPSLVPHRVPVAPEWQRQIRGLELLKSEAAVLHSAAWAESDKAAEWRIAAAVQQRLTVVPLIRSALEKMPRLPRRALVREVLDDVELGAHSGSELDFLRFCRRFDLPLPDALQVLVRAGGTRYLDARWTRQRISLELDGTHHREVAQWSADTLRSLHLAVAARGTGEQLVRLTRANLRHDDLEVAELLRRLLL